MKSIFSWLIVVVIIALGFIFALSYENKDKVVLKNEDTRINYVKFNDTVINVEIAGTFNEREKGLSGRANLDSNAGLLFVFEEPGKNMFWMKDMNFAIDIIWLDANKKVIYIKENAKPSSYPDIFGPDSDSKYVLEVNAFFAKKNNLKVGDILSFF